MTVLWARLAMLSTEAKLHAASKAFREDATERNFRAAEAATANYVIGTIRYQQAVKDATR